jgi:hypothetical protein
MPVQALKVTTIRVDPDVLRKARFYLDIEHKSVTEYLADQLATYVAQREEQTADRQRRPPAPVTSAGPDGRP